MPDDVETLIDRVRQGRWPGVVWVLLAVAVCLFAFSFALSAWAGNVGLRQARDQVADFQAQSSCRAELAANVNGARSNVEAIDGQIISTLAVTFADALGGPLEQTRRDQLRRIFQDQLETRDSLQTVLDDALKAQEAAPDICPG